MHEHGQQHRRVGNVAIVPMPVGAQVIEFGHRADSTLDGERAKAWNAMCDANPRLHDGPILAVDTLDAAAGALRVRADSFARLCTQGAARAGEVEVRLLGVKAVITAHDRRGEEHVLILRRHHHTRVYPDMWEVGPGGGLSPPSGGAALTPGMLVETLIEEAMEEANLDLSGITPTPRAAVALMDDEACSCDVCFPIRLSGVIDARRGVCAADSCSWEVTDSAWLSRSDAPAFLRDHVRAIAPPMRAVLNWMGWDRV